MKALSFQQSHPMPFYGSIISLQREQLLVKVESAKDIAIHTVCVNGNVWWMEGCAPLVIGIPSLPHGSHPKDAGRGPEFHGY